MRWRGPPRRLFRPSSTDPPVDGTEDRPGTSPVWRSKDRWTAPGSRSDSTRVVVPTSHVHRPASDDVGAVGVVPGSSPTGVPV